MIKNLLLSLFEDLLRGLSGTIGIRFRRFYYCRRLKHCGKNLTIEPGVHILQPAKISLGNDVWLDRHTILIAGSADHEANIEKRKNNNVSIEPGEIKIGHNSHIGIGVIIQGHGGVEISDCFTASPHSKIYSFSNDHRSCHNGTMRMQEEKQNYLETPVFIGRNVWIGMNVIVVGHSIKDDCFVKPNTIVANDISKNMIVQGVPASGVEQRFRTKPSKD